MQIRSKNKISLSSNNSSMTDLVFLLLIFFIVLATLVNTDAIQVNLPSTEESNPTPITAPEVTVSVDENELHYVNKEQIDPRNLEAELLKRIGPNNPDQSVVIMVDGKVPTDVTVNIISKIKKNGWKLALSTQRKK